MRCLPPRVDKQEQAVDRREQAPELSLQVDELWFDWRRRLAQPAVCPETCMAPSTRQKQRPTSTPAPQGRQPPTASASQPSPQMNETWDSKRSYVSRELGNQFSPVFPYADRIELEFLSRW